MSDYYLNHKALAIEYWRDMNKALAENEKLRAERDALKADNERLRAAATEIAEHNWSSGPGFELPSDVRAVELAAIVQLRAVL